MRNRVASRAVAILLGLNRGTGPGNLSAGAASAEGEAIQGTLRDGFTKEPVAGVTITVTDDAGFEESVVTAEDGTWKIEVPEPGEYTVTLDEETIPDGVATPTKNPLVTTADPGTPRFINFALGSRERDVESKWDRAAQLP